MSAPTPLRTMLERGLACGILLGFCASLLDLGVLALRSRGGFSHWLQGGLRGAELVALGFVAAVLFSLVATLLREGLSRLRGGVRVGLALCVGASLGGALAVAAFTGPAVRRSGHAPALWAASVLACALLFALASASARVRRVLGEPSPAWRVAAGLAALGLYAAHARVLLRLYAGVHALAAGLALALGWWALAQGSRWQKPRLAWLPAGLALLALGVAGLRSEVFRARVSADAPLVGYVVRALRRGDAPALQGAGPAGASPRGPSLALAGRDVVLVTVDALRADLLEQRYEGRPLMPVLRGMAEQGVWLRTAYCTTPHTSYSLASLMTGKYFRELSTLPDLGPQQTLPGLARASGWHSAGFYPLAVFQVDAERLGALATQAFYLNQSFVNWDTAAARVESAGRWMAARPRDQHLFLWVHLFEPHEPYEPPADITEPRGDGPRERYLREAVAVDRALGRLRELVQAAGRDPVWVVTADHGEEFGEHGGRFHGTTLFEEQVRVPWVIAGRGVPRARVDEPVSLVDLAPTVLAGLGISLPARLRGRDLGALALGAPHQAADVFASVGSRAMVRRGGRELVCDRAAGSCELFDLGSDPAQTDNLLDERPAEAAQLREALSRWSGSHGAAELRREQSLPAVIERVLAGDRGALEAAVATLDGLHGYVGVVALRAVGAMEYPPAREAFARRLDDPEPAVAREAALGLARLGDARGRPGALASLASTEQSESRRAALGLARLGHDEGRAVLEGWMLEHGVADTERDAAAAALRALGSHDSVGAWVRLLDDPRMAPQGAEALGALGGEQATRALGALVRATPYVLTRKAALLALATLHDPGAHDALRWAAAQPGAMPNGAALLDALGEPGGAWRGLRGPVSLGARGQRATVPGAPGVLFVQLEATTAGALRVGSESHALVPGAQELWLPCTSRGALVLRAVDTAVVLRRAVLVPAPPDPELVRGEGGG